MEATYSTMGLKAATPDDFATAPQRLIAIKVRLLGEYKEARERRDKNGRYDVYAALRVLDSMIRIENTWRDIELRHAPIAARADTLEAATLRQLETAQQHRINGAAQQSDAPDDDDSDDEA
jgi:hypothetical protein